MGVYGPFTAVLNQVVMVGGINPNADRLFIDNQSKYTLAIGFGNQAPPAVLTLHGVPWYAEIPPGAKTVPIPPDSYDGPFPGTFWVLALDPVSATRALTGTSSGNTAFFVQALLPREPAPADYAIPQSVDAASQQRMIRIPLSPSFLWTGNHTFGASEIFRPFPNIFATNANGWQFKNLHFYLYGCSFCVLTPATNPTNMAVQIEEFAADGSTQRGTHVLHRFGFAANQTNPYVWAPPNPQQLTIQPQDNLTQNLGISVTNDSTTVGPQVNFNLLMDCDLFNTGNNSWVTAIGGGATLTPIAGVYGSGGELF